LRGGHHRRRSPPLRRALVSRQAGVVHACDTHHCGGQCTSLLAAAGLGHSALSSSHRRPPAATHCANPTCLTACRHVEIADEQGRATEFPFSRGVSFYEVNDRGQIVFARDIVEPAVKPGAAALQGITIVAPLVRVWPCCCAALRCAPSGAAEDLALGLEPALMQLRLHPASLPSVPPSLAASTGAQAGPQRQPRGAQALAPGLWSDVGLLWVLHSLCHDFHHCPGAARVADLARDPDSGVPRVAQLLLHQHWAL
jgi:hypothetical protein